MHTFSIAISNGSLFHHNHPIGSLFFLHYIFRLVYWQYSNCPKIKQHVISSQIRWLMANNNKQTLMNRFIFTPRWNWRHNMHGWERIGGKGFDSLKSWFNRDMEEKGIVAVCGFRSSCQTPGPSAQFLRHQSAGSARTWAPRVSGSPQRQSLSPPCVSVWSSGSQS